MLTARIRRITGQCPALAFSIASRSTLAAIILLSAAGASQGLARVAPARGVPLSFEVYRDLGLHRGKHRYLRYYARLISSLHGRSVGSSSNMGRKLGQRLADADALVNAINAGIDPAALRNKIVAALHLGGKMVPGGGQRWRYGAPHDRMAVDAFIFNHGDRLAKSGKAGEAGKWLRAACVLLCQDSVMLGRRFVLRPFVRPSIVPYWGAGLAPASVKRARNRSRRIRLLLKLPPGGQNRLDDLYTASVRWQKGPFGHSYNRLCDAGSKINAGGAKMYPGKMLLARAFRLAARTAPDMHWRYELLASAAQVRQQLLSTGRRLEANSILKDIAAWARKIKSSGTIPATDRTALLRWIAEAMGP